MLAENAVLFYGIFLWKITPSFILGDLRMNNEYFKNQPQIDALTKEFVKNDFRIRPLIVAIVRSPAFRSK